MRAHVRKPAAAQNAVSLNFPCCQRAAANAWAGISLPIRWFYGVVVRHKVDEHNILRSTIHHTILISKGDKRVWGKPIGLWNCGGKRYFKGTLRPVCTSHTRKGQNTASGFRYGHVNRSGLVENLYSHEFWAKNNFMGTLSHIFTAHAPNQPDYFFRYQFWPRHSIRHARKPLCSRKCDFVGIFLECQNFSLFFALLIFCACA